MIMVMFDVKLLIVLLLDILQIDKMNCFLGLLKFEILIKYNISEMKGVIFIKSVSFFSFFWEIF